MLILMKRIWRGWKGLTHGLNKAISWTLMAVAYFVAVGPVAIWFKLFKPDPLDRQLGPPDAPTYGLPARMTRQDIRRAQRTF